MANQQRAYGRFQATQLPQNDVLIKLYRKNLAYTATKPRYDATVQLQQICYIHDTNLYHDELGRNFEDPNSLSLLFPAVFEHCLYGQMIPLERQKHFFQHCFTEDKEWIMELSSMFFNKFI